MNIDYSLLFLAYISIADECINDKSLVLINEYIIQNNISEESKNEMHKILGDIEDKISLESVLSNISDYDKEKIKEILYIGLKIILFDGYLSKNEENIINQFLLKNNITEEEYNNIKNNVENDIKNEEEILAKQNELGMVDNIIKTFLSILKNIPIRDKLEKRYNSFLLNGVEYSEAINKTSKLAKVDLKEAKKVLNSSKSSLLKLDEKLENTLHNLIKKMSKENNSEKDKEELLDDENKKEFENSLKDLKNDISNIIHKNIRELEEALEKKERALKYYTISFIGKTKAGKSTLHSIITGTGGEFIGVGKQRTTRFNRIYEWKNIRIIDTPGIGAPGGKSDVEIKTVYDSVKNDKKKIGASGGKRDEEIAKSVIDESDLICYVLKNDSIQETEFNFLKLIKERNKPIVILLNVKENIENEARLKIFLKEPEKWHKRKDEKSLQGHINRIREYAKKHYSNEYFEIFPVQMLAAKMSNEEKYSDKKDILYKSSHIQDFLDNIRMQIIDEGIIKRSQTMIDGSIYIINYIHKTLTINIDKFNTINNSFKKNKDNLIKKIEKSYKENKNTLEECLKAEFKYLKDNKALEFAYENYDVKSKSISDKWEQYLHDIKFNEKIENKIKNTTINYTEQLNEALKKFMEDIELFSKIVMSDMNFNISGTFNTKGLIRIISPLIGLAGGLILQCAATAWHPIGWALTIVSGVIFLSSFFLKSKNKKVEKARTKLYSSIKDSIEKNEESNIKNILSNFTTNHESIKKRIEKSIDTLCDYLENISKDLSQINEELKKDLNYLNSIYAYRILNYSNGNNIIEIDKKEVSNIKVKRDYGKSIIIKSKYNINKNLEKKITKIIQEEVIFEKIDK